MRVRINGDRFARMLLRNVLEDLCRGERTSLLVVAKQPDARRLIVLVIRDAKIVSARAQNVVLVDIALFQRGWVVILFDGTVVKVILGVIGGYKARD